MAKRRSQSRQRWDAARTLTAIGGIVALIGFAIGLVNNATGANWIGILYQLLGIVISILVLIQVQLIKGKKSIPFNWWILLIFVVLQALLNGFTSLVGITGLGILLEVIAVILLLINAL